MTKGLSSVSGARNARTKVGTVSISFNRPVNNPILQAAGMGAWTGRLGFSAEFTLTASNVPVVLKRLAGNKNFAVDGNNIVNTADQLGSSSTGNGSLANGGGASGSVYIQGKVLQH